MHLIPKFRGDFERFQVIDMHTEGEPARVIIGGIPELKGQTMMDKKAYFYEHCDHIRTSLCLEPRGHKDMLCVALTEPVHDEADFGVLFLESGGIVNMCGHGTIAAAIAVVEAGFVEVSEPYTTVKFDAPVGIVTAKVKVENGKAVTAALENVPSFLYKSELVTNVDGIGSLKYDIAFSGNFCALVDAAQFASELSSANYAEYTGIGMALLKQINVEAAVAHPELDIHSVDVIDFYSAPDGLKNMRNMAVFGEAQVDRSPCGTGTGAMAAKLYANGKLKEGESFLYHSILGCKFECLLSKGQKVGGFNAIVPVITGGAYIDGYNCWMIDERDPFKHGFLLGK